MNVNVGLEEPPTIEIGNEELENEEEAKVVIIGVARRCRDCDSGNVDGKNDDDDDTATTVITIDSDDEEEAVVDDDISAITVDSDDDPDEDEDGDDPYAPLSPHADAVIDEKQLAEFFSGDAAPNRKLDYAIDTGNVQRRRRKRNQESSSASSNGIKRRRRFSEQRKEVAAASCYSSYSSFSSNDSKCCCNYNRIVEWFERHC